MLAIFAIFWPLTGISCKIFLQEFPARFPTIFFLNISHKIFPQDFSTEFLASFSCIIFLQDFPYEFPTRFSTIICCKIFPQEISCKIFLQDFPKLDPDWLAPHHPIPNAKFPPITALLNRPTYHKSAKVSPPPFPQILWEPQINECIS